MLVTNRALIKVVQGISKSGINYPSPGSITLSIDSGERKTIYLEDGWVGKIDSHRAISRCYLWSDAGGQLTHLQGLLSLQRSNKGSPPPAHQYLLGYVIYSA